MSIAWLVIFIILWTGFLAGIASLVTSGRVQARFAQLVWRGAALLSVAPPCAQSWPSWPGASCPVSDWSSLSSVSTMSFAT